MLQMPDVRCGDVADQELCEGLQQPLLQHVQEAVTLLMTQLHCCFLHECKSTSCRASGQQA